MPSFFSSRRRAGETPSIDVGVAVVDVRLAARRRGAAAFAAVRRARLAVTRCAADFARRWPFDREGDLEGIG
jgi:hypothetical protein